jgi:hypothetical protein
MFRKHILFNEKAAMTGNPDSYPRLPLGASSQGGADWTRLDHLLAQKDWKEADWETRRLMLFIAVADRRRDCLLTENDIRQFPCADLVKINRLWVARSQGRFGFSVIKHIYHELDCDYHQLAERVGWRKGDKWIKYDEIMFASAAPAGHLPITWLVPSTFSMYWLARFASAGWRLLLQKAADCNL